MHYGGKGRVGGILCLAHVSCLTLNVGVVSKEAQYIIVHNTPGWPPSVALCVYKGVGIYQGARKGTMG